ncbi:hypothetical protein EDB80DRAFT_892378 [Ilyonectria destructans]|nr:hypothetical protein EDB80DRAFT_892378 [Ilyonectria destructans]
MGPEWDISPAVGDAARHSVKRYPEFHLPPPEPIRLPSIRWLAQAGTSSGPAKSSVKEFPDFIPAAPQLSSQSVQGKLFSGTATFSEVSVAARRCMTAFSRFVPAPKEQQQATGNETIEFSKANRMILMNQFSRFKIWAANVEALSAGFSSVDYRFRDDSDIRDVVLKLLRRLSEKLELVQIADNSPFRPSVPEEDDADTLSSDSTLESDDESSRGEDKEHNTPPQPLRIRIIEETVTHLYKITSLAERSNIHTEDQSMVKWLERNSAEVDDQLTDLGWHIQWLLEENFAQLRYSPFLKNRLILAVLNRRRRLLYHGSRQHKFQHGVNDTFDSRVLASTSPLETQRGIHSRRVPEEPPSFLSKGKGRAVDSTNTTESTSSGSQYLDVAPTGGPDPEVTESTCPYCSQPLGEEMFSADKTNWNRHVLLDLQPYVCLFRDCDSPLRQYGTKDEWINHMAWTHAKIWTCQINGHEKLQFRSAGALQTHLQHDHFESVSANQLSFMVEKGARPAPDVFAYLAADSEFDLKFECPFCFDSNIAFPVSGVYHMASFSEESYNRIRDHISGHLESIALVSLPEIRDSNKSMSEAWQEKDSVFQPVDTSASFRPFMFGQGEERTEQSKLPSYPPQPLRKQYSPHVDSYTHTRPPSNSSYYTASSTPQQSNFTSYTPQPSPTQHSPSSAGPILRGLGSTFGPQQGGPAMAPPVPYRPYPPYQSPPTMGGSTTSNTHQLGGQIPTIPGVVVPQYGRQMMYRLGKPAPQSERPFKCDQCVQSFSRNHDLKRHKRIHLVAKAFSCTICSKSFSRKDALKRHQLVKGCRSTSVQASHSSQDGKANRDVDIVESAEAEEESGSHMQKD